MKVFIKRFYGFDPVRWPVVSFSRLGSLDGLLADSGPGDVVVFTATLGEEVEEHERGRLLGFAEFGRKRIHSREALHPEAFASAPKGSNGDIQWPHSVLMTRAWRFTGSSLPGLVEVLGRQLPMAAISNAVLLSDEESRRVLALPREEVNIATTQAIYDERAAISAVVGPGETVGPIPASFTSTTVKGIIKPAVTYAFRFGAKNVWKVGWAYNASDRLKELNAHVPHEALDGQIWHGIGGFIQKWASAAQAYDMEQRVLASFPGDAKYGERVHCTREQLDAAWRTAWKG